MSFFSQFEQWVSLNQLAWKEITCRSNWIRSVRQERNLKGIELAQLMQLSPARISVMEKEEANGALTLKMMQRAAQALDCEFAYVLIPKSVLHNNRGEKPKVRVKAQ